MVLSKAQTSHIKKAWRKAEIAEKRAVLAAEMLREVIVNIINLPGNVDYLSGDGFGFTPLSNDETHIAISDLIELAENGNDITEDFILSNANI